LVQVEQLQKNVNDINNYHYYKSHQIDIDFDRPHSINISHFENSSNFCVQINEYFYEFDSVYEELQSFCDKAEHVRCEQLELEKNLDKLAIAAKFEEDQVWYRARICTEKLQFKTGDTKVLIEFIDYGNTQLTPIEDCVFLNANLSKFKKCAYKCAGMSYLKFLMATSSTNLNETSIESLLNYGKTSCTESEIQKRDWNSVLFSKINNEIYIEIDELYRLIYSLKLISESVYLDPNEYNENILRNVVEDEIKIRKLPDKGSKGKFKEVELDVVATNFEAGLKYMHFNLYKSMVKLKILKTDLDSEESDSITKISSSQLIISRFYLIKYKNKFYRAILAAKSSNKLICQLIDYGEKICVESNAVDTSFYPLTPKYFKYNAFSFHCQLNFGYNIEKVWTNEERSEFFKKLKAQSLLRIKLMAYNEPYRIEFLETKDFSYSFKDVIIRIRADDFKDWELEPQTILNGNNTFSLNEEFFFGGDLLKGNFYKLF